VITQTKESIFINITNRNNYKIYEKTISIYDLCNYPYIKTLDDLYNLLTNGCQNFSTDTFEIKEFNSKILMNIKFSHVIKFDISIECNEINNSNNSSFVSKIVELENKLNLVESDNNLNNQSLVSKINELENKLELVESKLKMFLHDWVYMGIENNRPLFFDKNIKKLKINICNDFMLKQIEQLPKLTEIEIEGYDNFINIMTNIDYHNIVIAHSNIKIIKFVGNGEQTIERFNIPIFICPRLEMIEIAKIKFFNCSRPPRSINNIPKDMLFCKYTSSCTHVPCEFLLIKNTKNDYYKNKILQRDQSCDWKYNTSGDLL
jgi:hypothetical protein